MGGRLNGTLGRARNLVLAALEDLPAPDGPPLVLVACSGGADSLALAAAASFFARRGRCRVGAVVVDHGLQAGSAEVAAAAAAALRGLGLEPVLIKQAQVTDDGDGPEAQARTARYAAFEAALADTGAAAVLLAHTLDDQAEQVLLGLARGSGTRSLAGMPAARGPYLRPFLSLRRAETLQICAAEKLVPWHDPSNQDSAYLRSRVRGEVMPALEQKLGPGIAQALARTSRILTDDADYLDELARREFVTLSTPADGVPLPEGMLYLPEDGLSALPPALRHRVIALASLALGGENPSFERILAAEALLRRVGSAGPIQLAGRISVFRQVRGKAVPQDGPGYGNLVFKHASGR